MYRGFKTVSELMPQKKIIFQRIRLCQKETFWKFKIVVEKFISKMPDHKEL